ncbi:TIR domain-containing protein [Candidatus Clostridium stratigraminis]|uniref:TIR domain-containing protein n=1 Tax=Candidatus Clostridium stratigraminis TaxID=3381661 RepID=A0ABW8T976_9CLOT
MYIWECKMCGARNEVEEGNKFFTCDSCGTLTTLPKITDENRVRLFNRANYFRQKGEFDKAISAFDGIIREGGEDSEAQWGMVLAKYGVEYVEDPHSGERIPTCHRVQNESILTDEGYLLTLDYAADEYTRSLYEAEAKKIDKVQQGILAISKLEEPYDVFICYKETTGGGSRTQDSVLAQDIYDKLTKENLNVFFSRITLEEKLGQQYEPYIFAALNSAKVMLVVTTEAEHVNSVWVKNEWSRFIGLMRKNKEKVLIPCYQKMDAYDLPEELSMYQAQDMNKIGFIQDLVRGVKKVCEKQKKTDAPSFHGKTAENTAAMVERAFMCLRDGDFGKADQLLEQVLNLDPRSAYAYLGKLMVERKVNVEENLQNTTTLLDTSKNYEHAIEYADEQLRQRLIEYNESVYEWCYDEASKLAISSLNFELCWSNAIEIFSALGNYKNSEDMAKWLIQRRTKYRNILSEKSNAEDALNRVSSSINTITTEISCIQQKIDDLKKSIEGSQKGIKFPIGLSAMFIAIYLSAVAIAFIVSENDPTGKWVLLGLLLLIIIFGGPIMAFRFIYRWCKRFFEARKFIKKWKIELEDFQKQLAGLKNRLYEGNEYKEKEHEAIKNFITEIDEITRNQ